MATADLGYESAGASADYGTIGAGQQRAYVPDALTQTVIFYQLSSRVGPAVGGQNPTFRMGIGHTTNNAASGSPDDLIAYTVAITPVTVMADRSGGAVNTRSITPFVGQAGTAFALVISNQNFILGHGMIQLANLPGKDNYQFYDKSNGSTIPTNPIGGSPATNGHVALWATGEVNVKPDVPIFRSPSGTLASTDLTPLLEGDFNDDNETLPDGQTYDWLNQVRIQVRQVSNGSMKWDFTYTASSTERTNRRSSRAYAGSALSAGVPYEWRIQHSDRAGAWSSWSGWLEFTINAGGEITTTSSTPVGKQNSVTPGPFVARWDHPNPLNANAAIIRLLDANDNVVQQMSQSSPYVLSPTVADNANISVPWANTGFPDRTRGETYKWQMMARDTSNAWMSDWSNAVVFSINATPNVPGSLSPKTGDAPLTSGPKLTCVVTDPDDTLGTATVTAEIKRADTTTVTRTMTWNATTQRYEYQTVVGTDWTGFQTLQWRAQASDGTSTSDWSPYQTFIYGSGPAVTVTAPADEAVITTSTYRIQWTVPSGGPQVKYRVQLTEVDATDVPVPNGVTHDTGDVVSANLFYDVPGTVFRNGKRFSGVVTVTNSTPLSGSSQAFQFTITYTPPSAPPNFTAFSFALHAATDSDAIGLAWGATSYAADVWVAYDIYRTALGPAPQANGVTSQDIDEAEQVGVRKYMRRITNPAQLAWVDGNPTSGVAYLYEIEQVIKQGLDELRSAPATATASVAIPHVVLTAALDPEGFGVEFRHKAGRGGAYIASSLKQDKKKVVPVGARLGRTIRSPFQQWDDKITFEIITDRFMSADQRLRKLQRIAARGGTLCIRDFTGLKRMVTLDSLDVQRFSADHFNVSAGFTEEYLSEGEAA